MLTLDDNPLILPAHCLQTSCQFDLSLYTDDMFEEYGIARPEKLNKAIEKRKAEYIAGRYCAHQSLTQLSGHSPVAIDNTEDRSPVWPEGYVGSITHSKGFASAVVAKQKDIRSIGIDSEKFISEKTANNIQTHILTETETFADNVCVSDDFITYLTIVFSAKESLFKSLHPLTKQFFDFRDARLQFNSTAPNTFRFELLKKLSEEFDVGFSGKGQYQLRGNFAHTAIVINQDNNAD